MQYSSRPLFENASTPCQSADKNKKTKTGSEIAHLCLPKTCMSACTVHVQVQCDQCVQVVQEQADLYQQITMTFFLPLVLWCSVLAYSCMQAGTHLKKILQPIFYYVANGHKHGVSNTLYHLKMLNICTIWFHDAEHPKLTSSLMLPMPRTWSSLSA